MSLKVHFLHEHRTKVRTFGTLGESNFHRISDICSFTEDLQKVLSAGWCGSLTLVGVVR